MPIVPPAPAVANAVSDAIGVRIRDLPITPDKVLRALPSATPSPPRRYRLAVRRRGGGSSCSGAYPLGVHPVLDACGTRFARPAACRAGRPAVLTADDTLEEAVAPLREHRRPRRWAAAPTCRSAASRACARA